MRQSDHQIGLHGLAAIGELARALKPGGRLVLSTPHPFATAVLGARAWCRTPDGERLEPPYGDEDGPVAGLPAAIVWQARRS